MLFEKPLLTNICNLLSLKTTEPATPLYVTCATRWDFLYMRYCMHPYPKRILTIDQQVQSYIDAGMGIPSYEYVEKILKSVGFYRLRGYSFQLYDNSTKQYVPGTTFEEIVTLYWFDQKLSALLFSMISRIEVALRARLTEALLIYKDALILYDASISFK